MLGELDSPVQLVTTGYGRDLMLKASLLAPILILAQRNRRLVAALAGGLTPTTAKLRSVARSVQMELAIAMALVIVAALLVAQIPGRGGAPSRPTRPPRAPRARTQAERRRRGAAATALRRRPGAPSAPARSRRPPRL